MFNKKKRRIKYLEEVLDILGKERKGDKRRIQNQRCLIDRLREELKIKNKNKRYVEKHKSGRGKTHPRKTNQKA